MSPFSIFFSKPLPYTRVPHTPLLDEKQDQELDTADDGTEGEAASSHKTSARRTKAVISIVCFVLLFSTALFVVLERRPSTRAQQMASMEVDRNENDVHDEKEAGLCGNSSAQAIARGCTFDQLTWSWYPPNCPHYGNDEFVKAEEWKFYLDMQGKEVATGDNWRKAMDNEIQLWGERREHLTHCVYLMLSIGQIIRDGTPHAAKLVEYEHLDHCARIMLKSLKTNDKHWNSMETRVPFVDYSVTC